MTNKWEDMHPALNAALRELHDSVEELRATVRAMDHDRRLAALERRVAALEALSEKPDEELLDEHGHTRAVVVVDRKLEDIGVLLRERNMLVITEDAENIDRSTRAWLLPFRTLIVFDERPFVNDASSFTYGIVSVRLLSSFEPEHAAKIISDAFAWHSLWNKRLGFLLLLRDDGEHEYRPLVD